MPTEGPIIDAWKSHRDGCDSCSEWSATGTIGSGPPVCEVGLPLYETAMQERFARMAAVAYYPRPRPIIVTK